MNAPLQNLHREIPAHVLNAAQALSQVTAQWDDDIVRQLTDYIAIPAKSPTFDSDWAQHGFIDTVMRNAATWVEAQKVEGLTLEIVRLPGRTPVLFFEIAASSGGGRRAAVTGNDAAPARARRHDEPHSNQHLPQLIVRSL